MTHNFWLRLHPDNTASSLASCLRDERTARRVFLALPLLIFLLGVSLRFYHLGFKGFWGDEIWTAQVSVQPTVTILRESMNLMLANFIPGPFYYLLAHISLTVFGREQMEFALRFPSAVAGSLAILALYALALRLWGQTEAVIAAMLLAVSPFQVWYSQEARFYAWTAFLSTLSTFCIFRALEQPKRSTPWICFIVASVLNLYNQPLPAAIVLGSQGWHVLVRVLAGPDRKQQSVKACISFAMVVLGYAPVIYKITITSYLVNTKSSLADPSPAGGFFVPSFRSSLPRLIFILNEIVGKFAAEGIGRWFFFFCS